MCSAQNCPGMEARSEGGCRWVQTELQRTAAPFLVRSHHPPARARARHCVRPSAVSGRKLKVAQLRTDPRTRRAVFSFVPAKPLPSAPRPQAGTRRARASAPTEAPPFLPYAGRWSTWCLATKENRGKEALPLTRRTRARGVVRSPSQVRRSPVEEKPRRVVFGSVLENFMNSVHMIFERRISHV